MDKLFLFFLWSILLVSNGNGQIQEKISKYPFPLDVELSISGAFGELRPNSLHAGIDFRTNGKTGYNVYAVDNGYVSRIKIEPGGYGKAIYITHPDGYVSVYAHLEKFRDDIDQFCKAEQYSKQQFGIDISPEKRVLNIKKGDIVGLSGNTGGSSGPHLHFEVRDENTQEPLNIIGYFNFPIPDQTPPDLEYLWIYPIINGSVDRRYKPVSYPITKINGKLTINNNNPITLSGKFAFGIQTYDPSSQKILKSGIYSIRLSIDNKMYFMQKLDKVSFNETRYCNSLIDYGYYIKTGTRINRLFVQPNNSFSIYSHIPTKGIIYVRDTLNHMVSIKVSDSNLNISEVTFNIKGDTSIGIFSPERQSKYSKMIRCKTEDKFERKNLRVIFYPKSLYEDLPLEYTELPKMKGYYSIIHQIHNIYTPIHQPITLQITPVDLPEKYKSKAVIVFIDNDKSTNGSGVYINNYVEAQVRSFGKYAIALDTVAPIIELLKRNNINNDYSGETSIQFKVTDDLTGVNSFRGLIDGKWALFEYDLKNDLIFYNFDPLYMEYGKNHTIDLFVSDAKENTSKFHSEFFK